MRNKYPGICYRCNLLVKKGEGHFERFQRGWRTQHATCAIEHRDPNSSKNVKYAHKK